MQNNVKAVLNLIRVRQWYKNLLVFIALIFSGNAMDVNLIMLSLFGFVSLSFMSSVNYIINDYLDISKDRKHGEKKNRPLANGDISTVVALILGLVFFILSVIIAFKLNMIFLIIVLVLFVLTQAYSLFLKNIPFLDVLFIAINFVIRAVSGAFIIHVRISEWLILCSFFLAMFLVFSKREGDLIYLKNPERHKPVLKYYTKDMLKTFKMVMGGLLILSYGLYCLMTNLMMIFTIPFAVYAVLRFYYLSKQKSEIVRHLELFMKDLRLVIAILAWGIVAFVVLYFDVIIKYM